MASLLILTTQVSQQIVTGFRRLRVPAVADVCPSQVWYDVPLPLPESLLPLAPRFPTQLHPLLHNLPFPMSKAI